MGRDISWYVLPKNSEHDKTKKLCFEYEFQGDEEDVMAQVYEKVTGKSPHFNHQSCKEEFSLEYLKQIKEFDKNVRRVAYEYLDEHDNEWCPKCSLFAKGVCNSPLLIDEHNIHRSYSSSYWDSKWCIPRFFFGSLNTEFVRLFRDKNDYKEITEEDVKKTIENLHELGIPKRNSDIEAYETTMSILMFLQKWTQQDDVVVIQQEC